VLPRGGEAGFWQRPPPEARRKAKGTDAAERLQLPCQALSAWGRPGTFGTARSVGFSLSDDRLGLQGFENQLLPSCRQREPLEKTFTSVDMHEKAILTGYHQRDLAASSVLHCFFLHFRGSFSFSRIRHLSPPRRFGSCAYPKRSY